ncbi:MAG: phosphoribosylanthranilate isomerase [Gemmatimonadota bacterium]|nr:phosphoribosylanthranilate isomerase [Gemmatimonadota bacterium]
MDRVPPVKVVVGCLASAAEARLAVSFGVAAIGLVEETPTGEDRLAPEEIATIVEAVPAAVGTFLLTAARDVDRLEELARRTGVNTLQLWDGLASEDYGRLRRRLPAVSLVQSIHVQDDSAVECAVSVSRHVDAILLDSADPEPPHRWQSVAGRPHDWEISRRVADAVEIPVIVSGGLDPQNVGRAIRIVRPFGVAVCSGVRGDGGLDRSLLVAFLEAVRRQSKVI